ncbi:hypothetical protein D8859_08660 [Streptococcus oralis]|nr:hypothetical protein D8859_08660 [Streptococcus oralis]
MKVLILEDVIEHQVRLERILNEISEESNIPISYKTTGKVREFKEYIENDEVNQLYFLVFFTLRACCLKTKML